MEFIEQSSDISQKLQTKQGKHHFQDEYFSESPVHFASTTSSLNYNQYHDAANSFYRTIMSELLENSAEDSILHYVDLGSSYGNTTLSIMLGWDWEKVQRFWTNNDTLLSNSVKENFHVTGVDLSPGAMSYGKGCGMFDQTFVQDFNSDFSEPLIDSIAEADILSSVMTETYFQGKKFPDLVKSYFLRERNKTKHFFYSYCPAFDDRNQTPANFFSDIPAWTSQKIFCKHRNFSDEEISKFNGATESWCFIYYVKFDPVDPADN